jgi:hypothetical protein
MIDLIDANTTIGANCDGLFEHHTQVITDDLMEELKSERMARSAVQKTSEYARAASVPTFIVELWNRQGYDFWRMSAKEIVAKLNADNLGAFVTARSV